MTDVLRRAIEQSGQTRYQIAKATGVPQSSLMRFLHGETSLRLDVADKLATFFRLTLMGANDVIDN